MIDINFLGADVALTKTFRQLADGTITKEPYPDAYKFTSHSHKISTLIELHRLISEHASKGHCLLKGNLAKPLVNERRKGSTNKTESTQWVCLDFDRHKADNVADELARLGLTGVSYILQWSSSHGTPGTEGTISCHVFMLLSAPVPALTLRQWLQSLNFNHFNDDLQLTRDANYLRWSLDVSTCQNDKLLYITTPTFIGMKDPLKGNRTEFVKGKLDKLPVERLGEMSPETLRKRMVDKRNELRKAAGMPTMRGTTTFIGEHEVLNKPGQATVTGVKDCGEYIRLNLNGGDSWAHWHFKDNFELLFSFKDPDSACRLKDVCPNYYTDLVAARNVVSSSPNASGDLVLAFRDKATATYWNGLWNEENEHLELHPARNETQLDHWMQSHNLVLGSYIPLWTIDYLPKEDWVVDSDNHIINRFVRSEYMRAATEREVNLDKECSLIMRIMRSMTGNDERVLTEFINWFACFFQRKGKPITCWTFHGIEGTGKGLFFSKIATPLLHRDNCVAISTSTLQDNYNAWIKNKLLVFVDEIDVDTFTEANKTTAILRRYITEDTIPIRDMRMVSHSIPNIMGIIFASNKDQPVYIPPTDRRYNVGRFQSNKLVISEHERDVILPKQLQAFADYLHSHAADLSRASQIVETEDRVRIAKLAVTSLQETANAILRGDLESLWNSMPDEKHLSDIATMSTHAAFASAYAVLIRRIARGYFDLTVGHDKLSRDEIRTIFEYCVGNTSPTPNKFTSMLRHCGIELERLRRGDDRFPGLRVKWRITDEFEDYLRETLMAGKGTTATPTKRKATPTTDLRAVK